MQDFYQLFPWRSFVMTREKELFSTDFIKIYYFLYRLVH